MWAKMKMTNAKKIGIISIFTLVIMVLRLLPMARIPRFWFDETFTIHAVRQSWGDMIHITSMDVHPPLYYICVKLCIAIFGERILALHLVSLGCFFLAIFVTIWFCVKYINSFAAALAALAFVSMPNMQKYALEIRMYSMAMLWILLSFFLAYMVVLEFQEKKYTKYWIFLALVNVAAAYTHYFAGVAVVGVSLFLLIFLLVKHKKWKSIFVQWIGTCFLMMVLYLPWMVVLIRQMTNISGNYWIDPLTPELFSTYWDMVFDSHHDWLTYALIALFFVGVACLVYVIVRTKELIYGWIMGAFAVVAIWALFGIGYSVIETPILIDRYLSMMLPILWLPAIVGLSSIRNKIPYIAMIASACVCFYFMNAELRADYIGSEDGHLNVFLKNHLKEGDALFHIRVGELALCKVYAPDAAHYVFEGVDDAEAFKEWEQLTDCNTIQELSDLLEVDGDIWCITSDFYPLFEELGYQTEWYEVGSRSVCRFYK